MHVGRLYLFAVYIKRGCGSERSLTSADQLEALDAQTRFLLDPWSKVLFIQVRRGMSHNSSHSLLMQRDFDGCLERKRPFSE